MNNEFFIIEQRKPQALTMKYNVFVKTGISKRFSTYNNLQLVCIQQRDVCYLVEDIKNFLLPKKSLKPFFNETHQECMQLA